MRRKALLFGIPVATMLFGGLIGFGLGQRWGVSWGTEHLIRELDYGLTVHSEVASLIRVGDTEQALWWLDTWVDKSVLTVTDHPDTPAGLQGLGVAKAYRAVVPPAGPEADRVSAALSAVAEPDPPFFCPIPSGGELRAWGLDRLVATAPR